MSEKNYKRHTVTAALPYANGPVHIGHLAGAYLPADIYVRYLRSKGEDVLFVCGSDEHGVAIELRAKKEGLEPRQIVNKYHDIIKQSFKNIGMSFDVYSRTSADHHHETATAFFKKLYEQGIFEEKATSQFYDEKANQFLPDRYITGTCPRCSYDKAYGDQCEKCGASLDPTDLIEPRSVITGNKPVLKETKHLYLPLQNYQQWFEEWIEEQKDYWKSNVYGQTKSWLNQQLQSRSITRDLQWGVSVPVEGYDGKVLYVWFDAPIGYISASQEWAKVTGNDWQPYWQDKDTQLLHFIGKDNIFFHTIIFPLMLKLHGDFILPDNVPANEFMNLEGDKISTSRNWAVWLHEYLQDFPGREDVLRYALTSNMPEAKDSDFSWKDFQARNNNELAAILGNFIHRILVLTHKYFDGVVPPAKNFTEEDQSALDEMQRYPQLIGNAIEKYRFREALGELMNLARLGNKYLTDQEPWKVHKEDPDRAGTILHVGLQIIANITILAEPFMPFGTEKLRQMINLPKLKWSEAGSAELVKEGEKINPAEIIFSKIEDEDIEKQLKKLEQNKVERDTKTEEKKIAEAKPEITFDDFTKLDLRVGKVLKAEKVEGADKLLKLQVDLGFEERTVVSGIAEHFAVEDVEGRKVSMVINLAPRKIRGVLSRGMILMAEDRQGNLTFVEPAADLEPGSIIR